MKGRVSRSFTVVKISSKKKKVKKNDLCSMTGWQRSTFKVTSAYLQHAQHYGFRFFALTYSPWVVCDFPLAVTEVIPFVILTCASPFLGSLENGHLVIQTVNPKV